MKGEVNQAELFDDGLVEFPDKSRSGLAPGLEALREKLETISPNAQDDAVHALLSGLPVEGAVRRFVQKVLAAAWTAGGDGEAGRRAAERARTDRLDRDTEQVREAAWKTVREFDRLRGLLRFSPEAEPSGTARYTARCAPDHFVLPLLADHFLERFGAVPWAIIDEKRNLALVRERGQTPELRRWKMAEVPADKGSAGKGPVEHPAAGAGGRTGPAGIDRWEDLWKKYHRSVNNEGRANPGLQKQFMPKRYWKYLTEMQ